MTKKEWLEDHQNQLQETYTQLETKANQLSWIRLGTIVPAVILAIAGMVEWSFWMLACALVLLVGFGIIYTCLEYWSALYIPKAIPSGFCGVISIPVIRPPPISTSR